MPLSKGKSNVARQENIEREIKAGKPPEQAVAIGYAQQRRNRAKDSACAHLISQLKRISAEM